MKLKELLNHYGKPITEMYTVLKDIPLPDLEYAYKQILINEKYLPDNPIPLIISYLPTGGKNIYKNIVRLIVKYGLNTSDNYIIAYKKMDANIKKVVDKIGGWRKVCEMDRSKLFYLVRDFTEVNTSKLLENNGHTNK